jgi:predicted  nucleic acid-binding Zn-ribbon protein
MSLELLLGLLTLILGGGLATSIVTIMRLKPESNKIKAEAFSLMQETVINLSKRLNDLETEKEVLYNLIEKLNERVASLRKQIRDSGQIPHNG